MNLLKNSDGPLLGTRRSARSPSATIHPSSRGHFFLQAKIQPLSSARPGAAPARNMGSKLSSSAGKRFVVTALVQDRSTFKAHRLRLGR